MKKLSDYAFNRFSQFGEDGIIKKIFEILPIEFKVCVEFGAWDGFHFSNAANLWTNGWKAILIESDPPKFSLLIENVKGYDCYCINKTVGCHGSRLLDNILIRHNLPLHADFLSIDIDGDDYHVFESLEKFNPRVVCCEFNPTIPMHLDLVPEPGNYFGCSVLSLVRLAEEKGFKLIAMTETNCFFVSLKDYKKFAEYQTSLEVLFSTKHLTYVMTGYNGDYILSMPPTYGFKQPARINFTGDIFYSVLGRYNEPQNFLNRLFKPIKKLIGFLR